MKQNQKNKLKQALATAAIGGVIKDYSEGNGGVPEENLNLFEKEFDVTDMSEYTLENLFLKLNLKPDKNFQRQSQIQRNRSPPPKGYGGKGGKNSSISPVKDNKRG